VVSDSGEEFGPYLVYEQLGFGGTAVVNRAELKVGARKPVALKRLHAHHTNTPEIVRSFLEEAQLASKLRHENIVETYDFGKVADRYFIAMEYIPGPTLTQIARQCDAVAGAIPLPVTLGILLQICDALDYSHELLDESGKPLLIVHRDVSPPNIIVSNTGTVKLFDFGVAKVKGSTVRSQTGIVIKGRFNYMAPEYLGGKLDTRADLFALGVIAHELLTGRRLFDGADDFEISTQVLEMPIQPPSRWSPQVTRDLDDIVLTALQRDPDLRWRSAAALRVALANVRPAAADRAQILAWVQWAFTQKPRPTDARLDDVIDTLESPSTPQTQLTSAQRAELDSIVPQPSMTLGGMSAPVKHRPPKALNVKRAAEAAALLRPAVVSAPVAFEESGVVVGYSKPAKGKPRVWLYLFMILLVAGGGVAGANYYFKLDLFPF
jgi:serine/threonine protein kinase